MWPVAVAAAEGDYRVGFQPFRDAIASGVLPPRYAKRDPRNMARVDAIVQIMIQTADRQSHRSGSQYNPAQAPTPAPGW
ncbi:hypothetical protein ES703_110283 [subsurface metagenome]